MTLKDLPVQPDDRGGDVVAAAYVAERDCIATPAELRTFALRWKALYALSMRPLNARTRRSRRRRWTEYRLRSLVGGNFDAEAAFACFQIMRTGSACLHARRYSCEAMDVMMPPALLQAHLLAEGFGVSSDIALIQANGGLGALE